MYYITSDHGGFKLKEFLKTKLNINDLGPLKFNAEDDYPDYVEKLANTIKDKPNAKGIIICRNGVGVSMAINKYKFIRAVLGFNIKQVITSKTDDNTNVLALPADYMDKDKAYALVNAWIDAEFSNQKRHVRRLKKVEELT
jgi:ribose 5-phosphate isomerase B